MFNVKIKNIGVSDFKKYSIFIFLCVFMFLFGIKVNALYPFEKIIMSEDTEVWDFTEDQGINNQPVQYIEGFGIGYTWIGDCVVLRDLDFGENGVKTISVSAANGDEEILELSVHINDKDSVAVGKIYVDGTGGFGESEQKKFSLELEEPIKGKQTVYIKWLNKTGSLYSVEFIEMSEEETTIVSTESESEADSYIPNTGDNFNTAFFSLMMSGLLIAVYVAVMVIKNNKKEDV